jgi:hypothetical protein
MQALDVSGHRTDSAHHTLSQLLLVRNAFARLFFVTIGALMKPVAFGRIRRFLPR